MQASTTPSIAKMPSGGGDDDEGDDEGDDDEGDDDRHGDRNHGGEEDDD